MKNSVLNTITPFVYGTTRLGDAKISKADRIKVAHAAMEANLWFHTSRMYDDALEVLGEAFKEKPNKIPKLIIKIGWEKPEQLRESIYENIKPMGVDGVELGQLCLGGELAEDFSRGGESLQLFQDIKNEGLVKGYVLEIFPWTSELPLKTLLAGHTEGIIDGFIFYLNPLQRFAANPLWDELMKREVPIVGMRTVSGGPVHKLRDVPGFAWKQYLQERAVEVAPIFEKSGIESWTEFCLRFAHSFPTLIASVGSTGRLENLEEYLRVKENITSLPDEIVQEIVKLHYRWSDELDIHAEPWTM